MQQNIPQLHKNSLRRETLRRTAAKTQLTPIHLEGPSNRHSLSNRFWHHQGRWFLSCVSACLLVCFLAPLSFNPSFAEQQTPGSTGTGKLATIFDGKTPLYHYFRKETLGGPRQSISATFKLPNGHTAATETLILKNERLVSYQLDYPYHQGEKASLVPLERNEGLRLTHSVGGKSRTKVFKNLKRPAVGPWLMLRLKNNWEALLKDEEVAVDIIVPDRLDDYSFAFYPEAISKNRLELEFKPTSIFLRMFVDPIQFIFDKSTRKTLSIKGQSFLKQKTDSGEWKDFTARWVFHWPEPQGDPPLSNTPKPNSPKQGSE